MVEAQQLPLPPGSTGPPLVGETLKFLKDGLGFIERGVAEHGLVFRTSLLGRKAAVICGPDATELFNDETRVARGDSMPGNIAALLAGHVLPGLDGDEHRERKHFVLAAFHPDALVSYVPKIRAQSRAILAECAARGTTAIVPDLKRFAIRMILDLIIGVSEGPVFEQMKANYDVILAGFVKLPVPLPGTGYSRARAALKRTLATFRDAISEHRKTPRDDGLSRILAARSPRDGRTMSDEEAAAELHHIVIAGLILWCWLAATFKELAQRPAIFDGLRTEAEALPADAGYDAIVAAPLLAHATMEVQRYTRVVPIFFGKAKADLEFKGHRIPAGWTVLWALNASHMRPEIYAEPATFDPERYAAPRLEHTKHACGFAPTGAGEASRGHKCAGYQLAPLIMKVFVIELVRAYRVEVPSQDWSSDTARVPPEPRSGLVVKLTSRTPSLTSS